MYYSTKTYGNDRGLSCCFRQWKSNHSHCSTLHGYSIGVKVIVQSETLDERNWVYDFGAYKQLKEWLEYMFDHTTLIAKDDPHLDFFKDMANIVTIGSRNVYSGIPYERGALIDLRVVDAVGCEKFAEMIYNKMTDIIFHQQMSGNLQLGVKVKSVEVFEHGANSAIYER